MSTTFAGLPWAWILVPVLAIHLLEEQLWPGGFVEWWNKGLFKSTEPEFPLSRKKNLAVNVIGLLAAAVILALAGRCWPAAPMILAGLFLVDAIVHIGYTLLKRQYSPGTVTGVVVYLPFVWTAVSFLQKNGRVIIEIVAWLLIGVAGYLINVLMNWRLVDRRAK